MPNPESIWYAVRQTHVILPPRQTIETFGATTIKYHLVSELMDEVNKVRVREGRAHSERPMIISPHQYADMLLDGFGSKANEYADTLRQQGDLVTILQYGLRFRKEAITESFVNDSIQSVADRVKQEVVSSKDPLSAVVVGADELWEVSLIKFLLDYVQHSIPGNVRALQQSGHIPTHDSRIRDVEKAFQEAERDSSRINDLGVKLQKYGLFEQYEDRFYALIRRHG